MATTTINAPCCSCSSQISAGSSRSRHSRIARLSPNATVRNKSNARILIDDGQGSIMEASIYSGLNQDVDYVVSPDITTSHEPEPYEPQEPHEAHEPHEAQGLRSKRWSLGSMLRSKVEAATSQVKFRVSELLQKDAQAIASGVQWTKNTALPVLSEGLFLTSSVPKPNWEMPSYHELRGWDVLAADIATMKQFYNNVQLQLAIWQLPLQNEYEPEELNTYFGVRPHLVLFRALEVTAAFSYLLMWNIFENNIKTLTMTSPPSEEDEADRKLKMAEMFKATMMNLGPTFVKVAQSLSTRSDIIGPDTARVLSSLQDRIPPFPTAEAVLVIEQELGRPVNEVFAYLSPEPVAAASLGQVYRGRTLDGQDVAIKVQRPNILFSIARDVYILRRGLGLIRKAAKINMNLAMFADEIGRGIYGELDYRKEAANAHDFQTALSKLPFVVVPKTLPHLTTRKVLTMEWISGTRPVDLRAEANGLNGNTLETQEFAKRRLLHLVNKGVQSSLTQLLDVGILHADPHPGNMIYTADNSIGYLDFGLICRLETKHKYAMIAATAHIVNGEWGHFVNDLDEMDILKPATDRFRLQLALGDALSDAVAKQGVPDFRFSQMIGKLLAVALKFRFQLPPYFMLILRSIASLEGMALSVDPNFKVFAKTYPFVIRRVLADKSLEMRRILETLLLTSKRELRWDRVASFMTLSSDVEEKNVPAGETLESTLMRLILTTDGTSLRRILLEANTRSLALAFVSAEAAPVRLKVASLLTDAFYSHGRNAVMRHTGLSLRPASASLLKVDAGGSTIGSRHLWFLLRALWSRLPLLLVPKVVWACVCVLSRAAAVAFHRLAVDAAYGVVDTPKVEVALGYA